MTEPAMTEPAGTGPAGTDRPDWAVDGQGWPGREASRFLEAGGLRWHVQDHAPASRARRGGGRRDRRPVALLVHGTGASGHSFRGLVPLLAGRFRVLVPDLPGHGFSAPLAAGRTTLPGVAEALEGLLAGLDAAPVLAVGHSAGAAILARMVLDGRLAPALLVALNGALLPLEGLAGLVFSPLARFAAASPLVARLFARHAARDPAMVANLLRDTGSRLDPESVELYRRLARRPGHVQGALAMMAGWDLAALARDLPGLAVPLRLLVGRNDRTVPPATARRVKALLPAAELVYLPGLGHLAHEERPEVVAASILERVRGEGLRAA
jgi:magnesium chelatase accessory protein